MKLSATWFTYISRIKFRFEKTYKITGNDFPLFFSAKNNEPLNVLPLLVSILQGFEIISVDVFWVTLKTYGSFKAALSNCSILPMSELDKKPGKPKNCLMMAKIFART